MVGKKEKEEGGSSRGSEGDYCGERVCAVFFMVVILLPLSQRAWFPVLNKDGCRETRGGVFLFSFFTMMDVHSEGFIAVMDMHSEGV